jgi:putative peptidoglycan lipid II flippase
VLPGSVTPGHLTSAQIVTLGLGTTAGVVVQTVALLPSLRAAGFRWRVRFDFRAEELRKMSRLGGWVFVYVLINQLGYLVIVNLATRAGHGSVGTATRHTSTRSRSSSCRMRSSPFRSLRRCSRR